MAAPNIDTTEITAAVTAAVGVMDSAKVLIESQGAKTAEAVRVAVEAAIAVDDATDQSVVDAAVQAVKDTTGELTAKAAELSAAIQANS